MKVIIIIAIVLGCIAFNEALECYTHSYCTVNCPQLSTTIQKCTGDNNKCYKAAYGVGVSRGCAKERCNVEVNAHAVLANLCCESDLCNSAIKSKFTISTLFMIMGAFILARM